MAQKPLTTVEIRDRWWNAVLNFQLQQSHGGIHSAGEPHDGVAGNYRGLRRGERPALFRGKGWSVPIVVKDRAE